MNLEPLSWRSRAEGVDKFRLFCKRYLKVPKGVGAGAPFILRPWQVEAVRPMFEGGSKIHLIQIARGNGKSTLIAAVCLYALFFGGEGGRIMTVAQNDASARRLLRSAARMVELNDELLERTHIYKERLEVPGSDSTFIAVASEQSAVEGEDLSLAVVDEIGWTDRDVFEATLLSLKRPGSRLVGIGTPSPPRMREKSPFLDLVTASRAGDESISLVAYEAPEGCAVDDWDAIKAANPGLGQFLDVDTVKAQMPPKVSESEHRRARLSQWVTQSGESFIPSEMWKKGARPGVEIPEHTPVVLALDGSRRWDATVLVMASVSPVPHLQLVGYWFGAGDPEFEVSHAEVEARVLELAGKYKVRELTADPWGWSRSIQVLEDAGVPVTQFPQNGTRMPKSLQEFRAAVMNEKVTHSNDQRMNRHVLNAQMVEGSKGIKLEKPGKTQQIDATIAATMAYSRAWWIGGGKQKKGKVRSYKR